MRADRENYSLSREPRIVAVTAFRAFGPNTGAY